MNGLVFPENAGFLCRSIKSRQFGTVGKSRFPEKHLETLVWMLADSGLFWVSKVAKHIFPQLYPEFFAPFGPCVRSHGTRDTNEGSQNDFSTKESSIIWKTWRSRIGIQMFGNLNAFCLGSVEHWNGVKFHMCTICYNCRDIAQPTSKTVLALFEILL